MKKIQEELVMLLSEKSLKISTAESCTGGMMSEMITDVSGSSAVFELGVCSYSNRIKTEVLGVPDALLEEHTELSTQCAEAMAQGALRLSGADIAVSTTGVAGPTGGTDENPVGTVYVALAESEALGGRVISKRMNFAKNENSSRDDIRRRCSEYVLKMAYDHVKEIVSV